MSRTDSPLLHLHPNDNVLVAKTALSLGQEIPELGVRARAQVPAGHKIAARRIAEGEQVKKYDTVIGVAMRELEAGDYVHSHNLRIVDYYRDPAFGADVRPVDYVPEAQRASFQGFVRAGGGVGTRNFIGILSSVNCSATVIKRIAAHFTAERMAAFPNVDGVVAFAQTSGCGMSSPSEHFDVLRRTLAGYARHPNLAGVLIVGLGCERNQVDALVQSQGLSEGRLMRTLVMQEVGGTRVTIEAGIRAIEEMLPEADAARRSKVSASHLKIGLECGGSDGFSGITANPALGAAMDILVRPRRHGHPVGNARDPWRGIHAHAPRHHACRGAEAAGPPGLVGALRGRPERAVQRRGRPRQPGRRPGQHLREIAGLGHEGWHHAAARRL